MRIQVTGSYSRIQTGFSTYSNSQIQRSAKVESNVSEMVEGMRDISAEIAQTDVDGIRIDNLEDLADYNYIVAGTVGNLLTDVFTYKHDFEDEDRLYEISERFWTFSSDCEYNQRSLMIISRKMPYSYLIVW